MIPNAFSLFLMVIREPLQVSNDFVVVGIAVVVPARLADFLQGIHDNQARVGMFPNKPL